MKNFKLLKVATSLFVLTAVVLFFIGSMLRVYAESGASEVISSRTTETGEIYIYIKNVAEIDQGSTLQIGNTLCENISGAAILSSGIPIRTVILLDNSLSFSQIWGEKGKDFIKTVIDNHSEGELFSLYTFSDTLTSLSDFSDDYEQLKNHVDNIQYLNQDAYLTDVIYGLLESLSKDGCANYTRVLVISDGADEKDISYTMSELLELMKNSRVPIYTVGAKGKNNSNEIETLFSFSRQTGADSFIKEQGDDYEDITKALAQDYNINCIKAVPDETLLDGSRKEAKITLQTSEGEVILTTSLQMPFGSGAKSEPLPEPELELEQEPEPELESNSDPEPLDKTIMLDPVQSEDVIEEKGFPYFIIIIAAVLLTAVAAVFVIVNLKKKREQVKNVTENEPAQNKKDIEDKDATVETKKDLDQTILLDSNKGNTQMLFERDKRPKIVLKDEEKPGKVFFAEIDDKIVVGRNVDGNTVDISLDFDQAVSRCHCEIIKKGKLYYIRDLDSGNGTKYSGKSVTGETPIMNGDTVEIGRGKYTITIEE